MSKFKIIAKDKRARAGVLQTAHGVVETPIFMPVGTQASVKSLSPEDLKEAGAQIILGNTYHLYLRPGSKLIKKLGGLHKFMKWDGPILTDSGGFQAFSLGAMIEHGVKKVQSSSLAYARDKKFKVQSRGNVISTKGRDLQTEEKLYANLEISRFARNDKKGSAFQKKNRGPHFAGAFVEASAPKQASRGRGGKGIVRNTIGNDIVRYSDVKKTRKGREKSSSGRVEVLTKPARLKLQTPEGITIFAKITENGVEFTSHLDGSPHLLTPEKSIEVQLDLGSDIVLVLDELLSPLHDKDYVKESLARTHRWEKRSQEYFKKNLKRSTNPGALLFGILQGVYDKGIREGEARWISEQGFDGVSIGGSFGVSGIWPGPDRGKGIKGNVILNPKGEGSPTPAKGWSASGGNVGYEVSNELRPALPAGRDSSASPQSDDMIVASPQNDITTDWAAQRAIADTLDWTTPLLPEDLPRHILGIGEVEDFFNCIERGADMFDCVAPTRRARNGSLYICPKHGGKVDNKFTLNISRAEFRDDPSPIDKDCLCYTCQNFSRAYLRHLFISGELLYHRLATIHNVYFMVNLTKKIREAIIKGQFGKLKKIWVG
jgi:queuine/archaeosine tRNA-ribosyltransferase